MADVLLIDDDPHQRALARLVLETAGHSVREAVDGQAGLQAAVTQPPDLVVCDVVMPSMNGYQFVAALREQPTVRGTPVILLTSLSERAQVRTGMTAGADDYLAKPVQPQELMEAVAALLKRRKAQQEAMAAAVKDDLDVALARQRETLASRYESRLVQELNSRWNVQVEAGREVAFDNAAVVVADLFSAVDRASQAHERPAEVLKRAHDAARDALYLFGAGHILHHGGDVVAVFPPNAAGDLPLAAAVRGAFALQAGLGPVLGGDGPWLAIAIDAGPFGLMRLDDPLHGDAGCAAVPGPTLQRAQRLRTLARDEGWGVVASEEALSQWPAEAPRPVVGGLAQAGSGTTGVELKKSA